MSQRCTRCLYDETVSSIEFDENGVCNYCAMHDDLELEYPTGEEGERRLREVAETIKKAGKGSKYDVLIGVSGGCDSSYLCYLAKEILGLRVLAVHFDNTWNSTTATENIHNVLRALDIDLHTYVVDNKEYDDIYRSFLKSGLLEAEAPTDIGLAAVLYKTAADFGIKYTFEGHSFRTEGISPLGWIYMDGKFIESVQKQYGTMPLKTFPNLWLGSFVKWTLFNGVRKIRPIYWIDYHKEDAKKLLTERYNWRWYGGHHLENRFTNFFHTYLYPKKAGIDSRLLEYSALVRSGQMAREEGLRMLDEPRECDPEILELVKKRLRFTDDEFDEVINQPLRNYREFKTYKQTFERMRPFWWLMYKLDRVPKSFYMKFCLPDKTDQAKRAKVGADANAR